MREPGKARAAGAAILIATLVLPLAGAWAAGRDLAPIFQFPPPLAIPTDYPRFSWAAVILVVAPFLALVAAWRIHRRRASRVEAGRIRVRLAASQRRGLPPWGWVALGWTVAWWVLAWNRFASFAPLQRYTFFPLWFGFIVFVNGLTQSTSGTCLLTRSPRRWLALFAISAAFWWVFEWLNRFSRNWHYLGVADFGAAGYALNATLCFSTVLPAVSATAELLAHTPGLAVGPAAGPRLPWLRHRGVGLLMIAGGLAGLLGTGVAPEQCYAALWAAPLALLVGDSIVARRGGIVADVAAGSWGRCLAWALAALICGFFWEMWNVHSAAKWIYTVPYVDRWHLFEMPLLGYLGYLPFGLECYFVTTRVLGEDPFSSASST